MNTNQGPARNEPEIQRLETIQKRAKRAETRRKRGRKRGRNEAIRHNISTALFPISLYARTIESSGGFGFDEAAKQDIHRYDMDSRGAAGL